MKGNVSICDGHPIGVGKDPKKWKVVEVKTNPLKYLVCPSHTTRFET